jgi:hypothetical protein
MTVVSGVPNDMIAYGDRVTALDLDLQRKGYHLEEVLSKVRGMEGAPAVPALGNDLSSYGRRHLPEDGKVRAVGHALLQAATAGASPVARKEPGFQQSLGAGVTTMDSANLDSFLQSAMRTETALERSEENAEAGQQLADDMNAAIAAHDWDRVRELARQLADRRDDADFTAAFFNTIGAKNALQVAWQIRGDEALLKQFDAALATATNSVDIDPNFVHGLFDQGNAPDGRLKGREWIQFMSGLLLDGKFSPDFLRAAGDLFLGSDARAWQMVPQADLFIQALNRNPEFAYFYMTEDTGGGHTRMELLLGEGSFTWNGGQIADDVGALVESMGKLGQLPRDTLFHIIAKADDGTSYYIPDGVRRAIYDLLTQQPDRASSVPYDLLGDFTSLTGEFTDEEKKRLFGLAEYDWTGHPDQGRIDGLQAAVINWLHDHRPADPLSDSPDAINWYDHVGQLMGLWAAPQRDAAHSEAEREHLQHVVVGTLTAVVGGTVLAVPAVGEILGPALLAGAGGGIPIMVAAGQEAADRGTASKLDDQMRELYTLAVGTARTELIIDAIAHDQSIVPASVRNQGTAAIQGYLRQLAGVMDGDSMLSWQVNGQPVFSGDHDPAYVKANELRARMLQMQATIDQRFLEFAE